VVLLQAKTRRFHTAGVRKVAQRASAGSTPTSTRTAWQPLQDKFDALDCGRAAQKLHGELNVAHEEKVWQEIVGAKDKAQAGLPARILELEVQQASQPAEQPLGAKEPTACSRS
jgi:hypothetical protein